MIGRALDPLTVQAITIEADAAQGKYGDFTSTQEALGVLIEEMDELRHAIWSNKLYSVAREATQVAAVAARLAEIAGRPIPSEFSKRSGVE